MCAACSRVITGGMGGPSESNNALMIGALSTPTTCSNLSVAFNASQPARHGYITRANPTISPNTPLAVTSCPAPRPLTANGLSLKYFV